MVARGLTWSHKRVTRKSADTRRNSASCECSDLANCNTTCREQETSTRRTKGEVRSRSIHNFMHLRRTILLSPTVWSLKTNKRLPLWGCCLLSGVGGSACVWGSPLPSDPSSFQARLLLFRTTNSDGNGRAQNRTVQGPTIECSSWQDEKAASLYAGVRSLCLYWLNNSIGSFSVYIALYVLCTTIRFEKNIHLHPHTRETAAADGTREFLRHHRLFLQVGWKVRSLGWRSLAGWQLKWGVVLLLWPFTYKTLFYVRFDSEKVQTGFESIFK